MHVAFEDAQAYAEWAGKHLPTEAEWEFAARGGLEGAEFVWGEELVQKGRHMANTWQGRFPLVNLVEDGHAGTAPVGSYPANGFGLHDMAGNVWQWTSDWFGHHSPVAESCCASRPKTTTAAGSIDPAKSQLRIPRKVVKGGSYLCAPSYCRRYRPAARMAQPIDTSISHLGFRCLRRPPATTAQT